MDNYFDMKFKSISENEALARTAVSMFILPLNPTVDEMTDVKVSVSEAVTNAVIHGYKNREGLIRIAGFLKNDVVTIIIEDEGEGIENIKKAKEPLYTTRPELERSGMGFTIMESFMDEVKIESRVNKGTKITMSKKINTSEETKNECAAFSV